MVSDKPLDVGRLGRGEHARVGHGGKARHDGVLKRLHRAHEHDIIDNAVGWIVDLGSETINTGSGIITFANGDIGALSTIWALVVLLPFLSVTIRRLHDTDRSGWWWWIWLVPCVGPIVLLVFMLLDSTPGDNRFGANPKGFIPTM